MMRLCFFIFFIAPATGSIAYAQAALSETEVFYRCYGQMAKMRPTQQSQTLLTQVESGSKSAVNACIEVLKKADLTAQSSTEIANRNNEEAQNVLHTFNSFHSTWFTKRRFSAGDCIGDIHSDLNDPAQPALFLTRALFKSGAKFSDIVTGTAGLKAVRDVVNPAANGPGPASNATWKISFASVDGLSTSQWSPTFNSKGVLYGVQPAPPVRAPIMVLRAAAPAVRKDLNLDMVGSLGGGLLGTQSYLFETIEAAPDMRTPEAYSTDGALRLPRRWAKYVYSDLLCRDLPVIRAGDSTPFVEPNSTVSFRRASSCTQCHASMDRMAMGIRDVRYAVSSSTCNQYVTPRDGGFFGLYREPTSLAQETKWPSESDANFYKRPPQGVLYYRSYDGRLIHKTFIGLDGLGQALNSENDLYVCAAKRYFEFFTGISVNLQDLKDPLNPVQLNSKELYFRDLVINMGLSLKQHQNVQSLIRDIFSSSAYGKKDFGAED